MASRVIQYSMTVRTRDFYVTQLRNVVGTFLKAVYYLTFSDTDAMTFRVRCDEERFDKTTVYAQERQTGRMAPGMEGYRHNVAAVFPDGLFGAFVDVQVTKVIPATGVFSYEGVNVLAEPWEREDEFSGGWY